MQHYFCYQDVSLERGTTNYNYLRYLLLGTHPGYPLKRSLLQFQDLDAACTHVKWAKMYVHYAYGHKASFMSPAQVPYISRPLQVHQVYMNANLYMCTRAQECCTKYIDTCIYHCKINIVCCVSFIPYIHQFIM